MTTGGNLFRQYDIFKKQDQIIKFVILSIPHAPLGDRLDMVHDNVYMSDNA